MQDFIRFNQFVDQVLKDL